MLKFLDIFYTVLHITLMGFNLLGWIWPATRRAHLITLFLTAASWGILGIWYGLGYCPLTDWHWEVKTKLGEKNLPNSFVKYLADRITGTDNPTSIIDTVTLAALIFAVIAAIYVNFIRRRPGRNQKAY